LSQIITISSIGINTKRSFYKKNNEAIAHHVSKQVHELFPSSRELNMTWYSVVKLAQSLYKKLQVWSHIARINKHQWLTFFLAGNYTQKDYIDSMEGATISGKQAAKIILANVRNILGQ
jgi:Uncharacterized conserved protein